MAAVKHRSQPRIKGVTRIPRGTSMLPALDAWVRREARIYGVSKAFVLANCVSFASRIPMVSYRELDRDKTHRRKTLPFRRQA